VRDRQHSTCSSLELKQRGASVFHFTFKKDIRERCFDIANGAEDVGQHLNAVAPKVEHRSTTSELLLNQPGAGVFRRRIEPLKSVNLDNCGNANLTRLNHISYSGNHWIKMPVISDAKLERSLASAAVGARYQFERLGYFCVDLDSKPGALVFNRTVALKDTWAKVEKKQSPKTKP